MPERRFDEASRIQTSVLAAAEKRALVWMAKRLPAWVSSDQLTLLGFVSMLAGAGFYWLARWFPAALLAVIACLLINWFGDSLDGTLARVRNQPRPRYGFYVDHVIDAVGTAALVCGMALSGLMTPIVALAFLVVYFLMSIEVYLATYCVATFRISYWGFGPTELRILVAVANLAALVNPVVTIFGRRMPLFDVGAGVAMAALLVMFSVSAVRNTAALYRAEPLPRGEDGTVGSRG